MFFSAGKSPNPSSRFNPVDRFRRRWRCPRDLADAEAQRWLPSPGRQLLWERASCVHGRATARRGDQLGIPAIGASFYRFLVGRVPLLK